MKLLDYLQNVNRKAPARARIVVRSEVPAPKVRLDTGRRRVRAIVVTDQAAGTAGMTLTEQPEPRAAVNDAIVQVHHPRSSVRTRGPGGPMAQLRPPAG